MRAIIRKNEILPSHLDPEDFKSIFWHIREHPKQPQSRRVEEILELLSSLRHDLSTRDKGQVLVRLHNALSRYHWVRRVALTSEGFRVISFIADREKLLRDDIWEYDAVPGWARTLPRQAATHTPMCRVSRVVFRGKTG